MGIKKERWLEHLSTLTKEERVLIRNGDHPSQSYPFSKESVAIFEEFKQKYIEISYVIRISMSMYQGRIAFTVETKEEIKSHILEKDLPFFYRGFIVKPAFFLFKKIKDNMEK